MSLAPPFAARHSADPFGDWPQWRKDMGLGPHRGKDWNGLPAGTPIPASGAGVCTWEDWNGALGWCAVIRYATVFGEIYIGYCHMRERTHLRYGTWVATGDTVGYIGDTGSASDGAHLHMTASWVNGNPGTVPVVDPMQFFEGAPATAGGSFTPIPAPAPKPAPILIPEEEEMAIKFGHRNTGTDEWMIVHPDLYEDEKQRGYIITTDEAVAIAWARLYKNGWAGALTGPTGRYDFNVDRDSYIAIQEAARRTYDATAKRLAA